MTKEEIIKPNSPRQIVGKIKKQAESKIWSKDSKDWYVAEIDDWVEYKLATQKKDLLKKIKEINVGTLGGSIIISRKDLKQLLK